MEWEKIFRRAVMLLIFQILFFMTVTCAEIQTYEGFGKYLITDETVDFAKNQAELIAHRTILEEICVYVKAQSTMIDYELDNDEIITISAGILRVIDTKFSIATDNNGIIVKSFVTAQVDTDELEKLLEQEVKSHLHND